MDKIKQYLNIYLDIVSYSFSFITQKHYNLLLQSMGNSKSANVFVDESRYTYQAPGPDDSRSPCPALNALANHGYLPRDGKKTFRQIFYNVFYKRKWA